MAHNLQGAEQFYEKLLGWQLNRQPAESGHLYTMAGMDGKNVAGLGEMPQDMQSNGVPPFWSTYVSVGSLDAALQSVADNGGSTVMPPMEIAGAGRMASISDPTGAVLSLWQPHEHHGFEVKERHGAVCWNELATNDAEKARDFYRSVFGWNFTDSPHSGDHTYFVIESHGKEQGGIMQMDQSWGDIPPYWGVYFSVVDVPAKAELVKKLGGEIVVPPFDTPVGALTIVKDPQGAIFSLLATTT
jgi:predicted enzyme related to lactoylglutathione lyase